MSRTRTEGIKARIPKGTVIIGTFPEGIKEAGRTYVVNVLAIDEAYKGVCYCREDDPRSDGHGKHCIPGREAMVVWAGSGGYWNHVRLADVEILNEEISTVETLKERV